jgi:hypothetical protein
MSTSKVCDQDRRRFLRDVATTAPAIAVAAAVPSQVAASVEPPVEGADKKQGKGYRVTQHVVDYYKTAAL